VTEDLKASSVYTKTNRLRVLVACEHYLPGFRAGGPIRSVANLVDWLADEVAIYIYTRDRDICEERAYSGILPDTWLSQGGVYIYYASPKVARLGVRARIDEVSPNLLYLNGWFSPFTIGALWNRRFGRLPTPILLAPRGELSAGALSLKRLKKRLYIALCQRTHCAQGISYHATSAAEVNEIQESFGTQNRIFAVPNLPPRKRAKGGNQFELKQSGKLSLLFLSRISPKKNLEYLLNVLDECHGEIFLTVAGPCNDMGYLHRLKAAADGLRANVRTVWRGEIPHADVETCMAQHNLFVLPTLGENYGHAIVEAWRAGLPTLISDKTPWRITSPADGGWGLPLEHSGKWRDVINQCVRHDEAVWAKWRAGAVSRAEQIDREAPVANWHEMLVEAADLTEKSEHRRYGE
jgi:glycosyltransferase involved in cell wall biosynthesis